MINEFELIEDYADIISEYTKISNNLMKEEQDYYYNYLEENNYED